MNRRAVLRSLGASAGALLAGCVNQDPPGGNDTPTETESPTPAESSTPTPQPPHITDHSFEVTDVSCGTNEASATVWFESDAVAVDGTITASDPCHSAELESASYDAEADRLRVAVRSYLPEENRSKACVQCLADVDYDARVTFENGLPGTVVVDHDGERVMTRER